MDKDLKYYLSGLGFEAADIDNLTLLEPALNVIDYTYAMDNIMLVVQKGYPIEDIDSLIATNPSFLVSDHGNLALALSQIKGDIETALKADPFLI